MGLFETFAISGSGLTAERVRLDLIASNIANANTTAKPGESPFQRQLALFQTVQAGAGRGGQAAGGMGGVRVKAIVPDTTPGRRVHDPGHPDADPEGYVMFANVNPINEMVDMMAASRAYEANLTALSAGKDLFLRALGILQ